jgi:GAF domain-containing protein
VRIRAADDAPMTARHDATIAELQRQLDACRAERDAALAREAALAEVMDLINRSPDGLPRIFDTILERALRLCGAAFGSLAIYDGEFIRHLADRGWTPALSEFARRAFRPEPGSALGRIACGEDLIHVADITDDDAYRSGTPSRRALADLGGARSALWVALRKDGALRGMIMLYRTEVRPFTDTQVELLRSFAAQAVIAMENARLLDEQREALEHQTATAEILQVINASPGDLEPVFQAIVEKAHTLCDAAFGSLQLWDGAVFRAVAMRGFPEPMMERLRQGYSPYPNMPCRRLVEGETVAHCIDLAEIDDPTARSGVALGGVRSILYVALRKDDVLLGQIVAARREVRPFSDKEIALVEGFAAQAVIAMENARLLDQLRQRTADLQESLEYQTATSDVLKVINASPGNLQPVFDAVLEKAMRLCGAAFGSFYTYDGEQFQSVAQRGIPAAYAAYRERNPPAPLPGTPLGRAIESRQTLHILDLKAETPYLQDHRNSRAMVELGGIRTILSVPLVKDGTIRGLISVFRQEVRAFSDKEVALLENFAAQAVIAIENARLLGELRERTADLQESLEYQTATSEVLKVISGSDFELEPVFQAVVETAARLCRADQAVIYRYHDGVYRWAAGTSLLPDYEQIEREARIPPGTGTLVGRVALDRRPIEIVDVLSDPQYEVKDDARVGGIRTLLGVPLMRDGAPIGVIGLARQRVEAFTERQIELVKTFADQAVIAIENARLVTEQREALEQQTATAEVLQVINTSPGDLGPVFDVIGAKAIRLCDAAFGAIMLPDGDRFRAVALGGVPEAYAEYCRTSPDYGRPTPGSLPGRMRAGADVVHVHDLADSAAYPANRPATKALIQLGGGRTLLGVALRKDSELLGMITIFRQEVRPFSDRQIALLRGFAAQAVIAMENARLLQQLHARTDELRVTFENMGDGVALYDETQHLVAWNRKFQEIFDVPDSLLEQRGTYTEHVRYLADRGDYGPGVDPEQQVRRQTARTSESNAYERTRPDGRVIEVRRNPVPGGGFVLIFSDITERKRNEADIRAARDAAEAAYRELKATQANLIQAEKMASLGQLTAGIAHEIKNPLNFVNNFADLSVELLEELNRTAAPGLAGLDAARRAEVTK